MEYERRIPHDENNGMDGIKLPHKRKMEMRDDNHGPEGIDYAWETSKENVMPLKRGRNVQELNRALRMRDSFQAMASLDIEANEMEQRIHTYQGNDPLSVWVQYVRWIETNRPEDTRKKFTVLEKCTRQLKVHVEYKNDLRYIRLWIQYADLVSNPKDIFKYLYQNKIGEHVSLFYVGWAWVLESMGNYPQAHKVYLKGMQKKAQPQEMLERKNKEFQRRMSRHWLKMNNSNDTCESLSRQALDDMTEQGVDFQRYENSDRLRRYAQQQAQKTQQANAHKPVFTIYQDPVGTDVDVFDENADWKVLDTVKHQNKENDLAPARWTDGPLGQRDSNQENAPTAVASALPIETLQVFVDEEFSVPEQKDVSVTHLRERSLTLRQRMDGISTEEEQLARQPLKNFDAPQKDGKTKPPPTDKVCNNKSERQAYDAKLLVSSAGEVLSFEEVRARKYATQHRRLLATSTRSGNAFLEARGATDNQNGLVTHQPGEVNIDFLDNAAQDDMTINTRVAIEDVNNMFCSPPRVPSVKPGAMKSWDVTDPEPVERKLHFSIFDDSVESVGIHANDVSLRQETTAPTEKQSFSVFADDFSAKPTPGPRTASKLSSRKPLGSRDDLARRDKLTNKDVILQMQSTTNPKRGTPHPSTKTRDHERRFPQYSSEKLKIDDSRQAIVCGSESESLLDPYRGDHRGKMHESAAVKEFLRSNTEIVRCHASKIPALWTSNQQQRRLKKAIQFCLDANTSIEVIGFLGSGAFAQVFTVQVSGADAEEAPKLMAMKFEKTKKNLTWEVYVAHEVRKRLESMNKLCGILPLPQFVRLDIFPNGALLLMEKSSAGTMHDLLNYYRKSGKGFPEPLAVYYAIKMLRAVELLHDADVLHGDIKPDNWLLVPGSCESTFQSPSTSTTGCKVYRAGGLSLIDFGRSIDLRLHPKGVRFIGDCHVKGFKTVEMLTKRPWTKQIDTFGICGTLHCMLFGDYMEVVNRVDENGESFWTINRGYKRYWQVGMWRKLFGTLLNVKSCDDQPSLPALRRQMEAYFAGDNVGRIQELRDFLSSQDRILGKAKV